MEEYSEQNELYEHYRFLADPGQAPLRIDKYLCNRIQNASRNKIQIAAKSGNIFVNEKQVKPNYKVKPNDEISIVMSYPPREIEILPEDIPITIMYEDDDVMVINKEAGMVVHPGYGNYSGTLVNALVHHLKDTPLFQTGDVRPGLVHRIDKNTSGLIVIAKKEIAQNKLAKQFYNRTIDRKYVAIVWGDMEKDAGTIEGHVGRHVKDRKRMHVFPQGEHGKYAITHYKVLERLGYVNVVECKLDTGRTHQIRVHFQYIKHPLFNDNEYGGDQILKGTTFTKYKQFVHNCFKILPRQALHAKSMGFIHPMSGKEMYFDSELPDDMQQVIEKWRAYTAGREKEI